jgi:hypothetical protein
VFFIRINPVVAQENIRIVAYNLNDYGKVGSSIPSATGRNPYFRTIKDAITPDILVACELYTEIFANNFLDYVMNDSSGSSLYNMSTFLLNSNDNHDNNVIYYKPSKFTFLSRSRVSVSPYGNHPLYEFQLYNNLTGNKIIIYGVHFSSGTGNTTQRNTEATALRTLTLNLPSSTEFIAAGDFNLSNGTETTFGTLLNQSNSGYFIDPLGYTGSTNWANNSFATIHTQSTTTGLYNRFDLILNSQSVVNSGGITYNTSTFQDYGNDGSHYGQPLNNSPTIPEGTTIQTALYNASDHLPVFANYTFDIPTPVNPPYPGSIVFTQVGADDPDVIEFMTLYRMNLTTLKLTTNSVNSGGSLNTGDGTFDFSSTTWTDVPGGTFIRLGDDLITDNDASDRILKYDIGSILPLTTGGEQLIAYTGPSPNPTYYIAGIHWGDAEGWSTSSYAPGTPSDIELGNFDNYHFNSTVAGNLYTTRNALTNISNWTGGNSYAGYQELTGNIGDNALPVELTTFNGQILNNVVLLNWETSTEVRNYGFDVEKSNDGINFSTLGFVQGNGNSNSTKYYSFEDNSPETGINYYRLKQIDTDGSFEYSKIISANLNIPTEFTLSQNYPNPFNPATTIDFTLPSNTFVSLKVYDLLGNQTALLINEQKEAGSYSLQFDGTNLASGNYIYVINAGGKVITKKMTLLK